MRSTRQVFEDHLEKREQGAVDEDIRQNYSPETVLLTGTGMYTGHDGVKKSAEELADYLGKGEFTYRNKLVSGPYAFLEWTAKSSSGDVCDGADSFVIKDGGIVFQSIHYTVS